VVTGNGLPFMAGRVSYMFGLTGACVGLGLGTDVSSTAAGRIKSQVRSH